MLRELIRARSGHKKRLERDEDHIVHTHLDHNRFFFFFFLQVLVMAPSLCAFSVQTDLRLESEE